MKRSLIAFIICCIAYGATLLTIGIYLTQLSLAEAFVQLLAEKTGFLALILGIVLYLPILMMDLICYFLYYLRSGLSDFKCAGNTCVA